MSAVMLEVDAGEILGEPNHTGTPERNLLLAILERAILDYVGNNEKDVSLAEDWIFGDLEEERIEEFSFPWICHQLDLDTSRIAEIIRQMPKRGDRRIAPWYFSKNEAN